MEAGEGTELLVHQGSLVLIPMLTGLNLEFQERVENRQKLEFNKMKDEREERHSQVLKPRKEERVIKRKMLYYLKTVEERLNRLREEE
ncbi:Proteasome component (PCI) domain-containing protein [Artemisia annua]|uniref:Proteasome component (PCI) domain-containing protein n=1 Tax=Artemisia annua TaxID=35608 RepID=A0A2U1MBF2_ARTAN|nr:Proteasome component (PCI) domain-containing protein [Artemisia annua]